MQRTDIHGYGSCGRWSLVAATLTSLLVLATAVSAAATITVGQLFPPESSCGDETYLQTGVASGTSYTVPAEGVITSWSFFTSDIAVPVLKLKVARPVALDVFSIVGESSAGVQVPDRVNTFPADIPVGTGDVIGIYAKGGGACATVTHAGGDTFVRDEGDPLPEMAAVFIPSNEANDGKLPVEVTVAVPPSPTPPGPTPTPPAPPPPSVTRTAQSNAVWREGAKLPRISRRRRPPIGSTFSFALNEQATIRFAFARWVVGRSVGGKCVAKTSRNTRDKRCTHTVIAGSLWFTGHAGTNSVLFQGRVSSSNLLKPGRYSLAITATSSAGTSTHVGLAFEIVR